jgi:hypothetical protein
MIKFVITGGCSFSDQFSTQNWTRLLEVKINSKYPDVKFRHTGSQSQGQELIQKKISIALIEELKNYKPHEILVLPMWSGTERKAFWIDNTEIVKDIMSAYEKGEGAYLLQFADLYTQIDQDKIKFAKNTKYNPEGGWYMSNYFINDSAISKEFFNLHKTIIGYVTMSLENIIFLQNLCKLKGVNILQSFFRSYVYNDIIQNKDHLNLNYLFSILDHDTIVSTTGLYEHLRQTTILNNKHVSKDLFYKAFKEDHVSTRHFFCEDNAHPNVLGHTKWLDEVLIPKLNEKNFFNINKKDIL